MKSMTVRSMLLGVCCVMSANVAQAVPLGRPEFASVAVLGGAVSGYGLASAFKTMKSQDINPNIAATLMIPLAGLAYYLRNEWMGAVAPQYKALGLGTALFSTFFFVNRV